MNRTEQLLDQLLDTVHPKMAESIRLAAIPYWYDAQLFAAIRNLDDGRNNGILERLQDVSFVLPVQTDAVLADQLLTYRVRDEERVLLNEDWVEIDAHAYLAAHQRAFDYYQYQHETASPSGKIDAVSTSLIEEYPQLYHQFFVDLPSANRALILLFRNLYKERKLGAIDNLLEMLDEAHVLLHLLADRYGSDSESQRGERDDSDGDINGSENGTSRTPQLPDADALRNFDVLRTHYRARALQLRSNWQESLALVRELRFAPNLPESIAPYVIRSYGTALAKTGQQVNGIYQLYEAIEGFKTLPVDPIEPWQSEIEQAYTMIELGETYVALAQDVRGSAPRDDLDTGIVARIRDMAAMLLNGPLVVYLSWLWGRRVWMPSFWPILRHLDWVIARLFAKAVELYEQADEILERTDALDEHDIADEKLAFLYLVMGDAESAHYHFGMLLNDPNIPLSEYRRARITVGVALTHIQQKDYTRAIAMLEAVLPILNEAENDEVTISAHALLSEAYIANEQPEPALTNLETAVEGLTARGDEVTATSLLERIELLLDNAEEMNQIWVDNARQKASEIGGRLQQRVYDIGFYHPILRYFRQFVALLLPGAIVLGALITLDLRTSLNLAPELNVDIPPLLNPLDRAQTRLSPDITPSALVLEPDAQAGLLFGLLFLGGFLALSLIVGWAAIELASLAELEKHQDKRVTIDDEAVTVGTAEKYTRVERQHVQRVVRGDMQLWRNPLPEQSATALRSDEYSAIIPGVTNWYTQIVKRFNPESMPNAKLQDLSYTLLSRGPGSLYLLNLLILEIVLILTLLGFDNALWSSLPATSYNIVDLFPYLFLGATLIPTWWSILRPLQINLETRYVSKLPWIVLGTGAALTTILAVLLFRPLFTAPDIYPVLVIVPSVLMAAYVIWNFKDGQSFYYRHWLRIAVATVAILVSILLISVIQRDVRAYHSYVQGNVARDAGEPARAIAHYQRAVDVGRQTLWGIFDPVQAFKPNVWPDNIPGVRIGLPIRENIPWFLAQKNLAALQNQKGDALAEAAIENYDQLIDALCWQEGNSVTCVDGEEKFLAWRAMALTQMAAAEQVDNAVTEIARAQTRQLETESANKFYASAILDYERAIAINPEEHRFHLWLGFTHQSLHQYEAAEGAYQAALAITPDDNELQRQVTNLRGWIAYEQEDFPAAVELFSSSVLSGTTYLENLRNSKEQPAPLILDDLQRDALRGLGHASYQYGRQLYEEAKRQPTPATQAQIQHLYQQTERSWMEIQSLSELAILKSLGTLHWAKAQVADSHEDRCAEWTQAEQFFQLSVLPSQVPEERAFTYRSLAQIEWALRICTNYGYNRVEMIQRAVNSYSEAIKFSEEDDRFYAYYVHMRGRIGYVLWTGLSEDDPTRLDTLVASLDDFLVAIEADPNDHIIREERQVGGGIAFDYIPNEFAREILLPAALEELQRVVRRGDTESASRLRNALGPLLLLVETRGSLSD